MSGSVINSLICPVCGKKLDNIGISTVCSECGYVFDAENAEISSYAAGMQSKDNAASRLMSTADTYFSRKNYDEAYTSYSSVLDSDSHCLKALFRRNIIGQYLMLETSSVYLGCEVFFRKTREMLTSLLEADPDEKLILTLCNDMLEFILFNADYERKYADHAADRQRASEYLSDLLELLDYTRFIMSCITAVNHREAAFAAVECFETGAELHSRILAGAEYSDQSGSDSAQKCQLNSGDLSKANRLYNELFDIKKNILENADEALAGELKALEKKDPGEKAASLPYDSSRKAEYERLRKANIRSFVASDRKNIIFGMISKTAFVFAIILAVIFIAEAIFSREVISGMALSAFLLAAVGAVSMSLERNFDDKRRLYAKLVHGKDDRHEHK